MNSGYIFHWNYSQIMSIKQNHVPAMLAKFTVTMLKILSVVNPSIRYHNMRKIPWNVLVAYWLILLSPWDPRNHAKTSVVMALFPPFGSHLLFLFVHTTKQYSMFIAPSYKNIKQKNAHKLYTNMTSSGTACSPTASLLFSYLLSNWTGGRGRVLEILVYSATSCTHMFVLAS